MLDWLLNFVWTAIPLWVWIVAGGVMLGAAFKTFGWQGVVGGLAALLTLGVYRQGYRDADQRKPPLVPVRRPDSVTPTPQPNKPRRNIWSLQDILRGRND